MCHPAVASILSCCLESLPLGICFHHLKVFSTWMDALGLRVKLTPGNFVYDVWTTQASPEACLLGGWPITVASQMPALFKSFSSTEIHQFCLFAINFLAECGLALKLDLYETVFTRWELFAEFKQFSPCRQFNCYHLVQITAKFDN